MGKDGPGSGAEERVRALKPPADRLYGRIRGHTLRPRQQLLLDEALPRLRMGGWGDPASAFAERPGNLALEVGFGGGEHAAELAAADPRRGVIACEVFVTGICSLLSRLVPEPLDPATAPLPGNLRIHDDDARPLLLALPEGCLDLLVLMFPDPWPKVRHAKRRFVHPAQVGLVARALRPGGEWRIASDDPTYQRWVEEVMGAQTLFEPCLDSRERPSHWPQTRYEAKALRAGRQPRYWCFVRGAGSARPMSF